ncbi:MAG: dUTP diphosphatase [Bacilli bacterium]|jgi:dUTP pyrophosphatase
MRGFKKVSLHEYLKYQTETEYERINLPKRATEHSAGYDFYLPYVVELKPGEDIIIASGIKAYMKNDEVLFLVIRSSCGFKGLRLKNQVGVIDADYYNNPKNEGHILIAIENTSKETIVLKENERIVQGIFLKYLLIEDEEKPGGNRAGGIGSTKK